jgi:hypothetical protein
MTTTLFIVAILLALWLCLRAASNALLPTLRLAIKRARQNEATTQIPAQVTAQVTAEDYETYLNAMEAAFKTARIPSFPKTPRKPRQTKLKTPPQTRPSDSLEVTTANVASKTKPKNRPQIANKCDIQPHSAECTNLGSQVVPNHQPSRMAISPINLPLTLTSSSSPSEIVVHSRPFVVSSQLPNTGKIPSEPVVESQSNKQPVLLHSCLAKLKQAINWSKTIFAPVLHIQKVFFNLFTRQKPKPPPDQLDSGVT